MNPGGYRIHQEQPSGPGEAPLPSPVCAGDSPVGTELGAVLRWNRMVITERLIQLHHVSMNSRVSRSRSSRASSSRIM